MYKTCYLGVEINRGKMINKQKFLDLLQTKKNESGLSSAKFLNNAVSESKFSKFMQDVDYALTDKSLSEILQSVDIDLYTLLYNELAENDPGTYVKINYQYGEDGILKPLSMGDVSSSYRHKQWRKHEAVLCKYSPYEGWISLYKESEKNNILLKDVYKAPSIVFFKDKHPMMGIYSSENILTSKKILVNQITFEVVDLNFDEVIAVYPIDCSFAPKIV